MNIAALGITHTAQPVVASAAATATSAQGGFGAQLQAWLASQASASSGATQSASLTEPGRATPSTARHHHPQSSSTEANAANGTSNYLSGSASSASAGRSAIGTSAGSGTRQQGPGGLLLNDMMRGLQAYGATSAMA